MNRQTGSRSSSCYIESSQFHCIHVHIFISVLRRVSPRALILCTVTACVSGPAVMLCSETFNHSSSESTALILCTLLCCLSSYRSAACSTDPIIISVCAYRLFWRLSFYCFCLIFLPPCCFKTHSAKWKPGALNAI